MVKRRKSDKFNAELSQQGLQARRFNTKRGARTVIVEKSTKKIVKWTPYETAGDAYGKISVVRLKRLSENFNRNVYQVEQVSSPEYSLRGKAPKGRHYVAAPFYRDGVKKYHTGHIYQEWVFKSKKRAVLVRASSYPFKISGQRAIRRAQEECYYRAIKQAPFSVTSQKLKKEVLIYETSRQPRLAED